MGWLIDVAAGVLRGSGNTDLADWLKDAPKKLGEEIGQLLAADIDKRGTFSPHTIKELERLKSANPRSSSLQPRDLEEEYADDLNALVNLALPRKAIVARGFFHNKDCLVVWIIETPTLPPFKADSSYNPKVIHFAGSGIRVLILDPGSEDQLVKLNQEIERDSDAFVTDMESKFKHEVVEVTKNEVVLSERSTRRTSSPAKIIAKIQDSVGIDEAFRTMVIAKEAQGKRLADYRQKKAQRNSIKP
jgi:hypothetical protein